MKQIRYLTFILLMVIQAYSPLLAQDPEKTQEPPWSGEAPWRLEIINAIVAESHPRVLMAFQSPDMTWSGGVTIYGCDTMRKSGSTYKYEVITISNTVTGEEHIVSRQLYSVCTTVEMADSSPIRWSSDSRYLYYTSSLRNPEVVPIFQFDTVDLNTTSLGSGAPSPDGLALAIWEHQDRTLNLIDIQTNALTSFPALMPDAVLGKLFWLPDSSGVVVLERSEFTSNSSSVLSFVDNETLERTVLMETIVEAD